MEGSNLSLVQVLATLTKLTFDHHSMNESQKGAYSDNFINIRPQIADLGIPWWPKPELN